VIVYHSSHSNLKAPPKQRHVFALLALNLLVGCQQARLAPMAGETASVTGGSDFLLAAPRPEVGPRRVVFFVDQSYSMIGGICPTDVNNQQEPLDPIEWDVKKATNPGKPCKPEEAQSVGHDPNANRLKMMDSWLKELESAPDTKVLIIPFSGGYMETRRRNTRFGGTPFGGGIPFDQHGFDTIRDAKDYMFGLHSEHRADLATVESGTNENRFMGTSVPAPFLQRLSGTIFDDMKNLQQQGLLGKARYSLVYLSDGLMTPTMAQAKTALNLKKCAHSCLGVNSTRRCSAECRGYTQDIYDFWGSPEENSLNNIKNKLRAIQGLTEYLGEGRMEMSFVLLNPEKLTAEEKDAKNNYLMDLRASFPQARHYQWSRAEPPFSLIATTNQVVSYRLTALYALNLNYRVNPFGEIDADSDADGLFDRDELRLGTDPKNARTGGVCLDSLSVLESYRRRCNTDTRDKTCDPKLDLDADGLNECEENILGSQAMDFDTDGDGIPDGLEVLYGLSINRDDSVLDSNNDNQTNLANFQLNLMPQHSPDLVPPANKVLLRKESRGSQSSKTPDGLRVQREAYSVRLDSAPVGPTLAPTTGHDLALTRKAGSAANSQERILGGAGPSGKNTIVFLARVIDSTDPTRAIWMQHRQSVDTKWNRNALDADLSQMTTLPARDPISINDAIKDRGNTSTTMKTGGAH
jgi:hypothetical protein